MTGADGDTVFSFGLSGENFGFVWWIHKAFYLAFLSVIFKLSRIFVDICSPFLEIFGKVYKIVV